MATKNTSKGIADGIPVYCSFDKVIKIESLKQNPRNPNKHPAEQVKLLAEIIKLNGWRAPITVSNLSGYIVKGHGRLMAAQLAGLKEVPVDYQEYANDGEEMADLLADNRISELSETDKKALLDCFEHYDTGEVPFNMSGYTEDDYKELASMFDEFQSDGKDEQEAEMKKVEFSACDCKKVCPCYGQKGCGRV